MRHLYRIRFPVFLLVLAALCFGAPAPASAAAPIRTYIAIGDSVGFGQTDILPTSNGNQGYVKLFADYLATEHDGIRPHVLNFSIPGETSDSFYTGVAPPNWFRGIAFNTHYSSPTETQFGKLLAAIAAEKAAGHRITHVSLALGGNDFFALLGSPEFNAPGANVPALIGQMLLRVQTNYAILLTTLRTHLPKAKVMLLTYYNPFTVFGPENPLNQLTEGTVQGHTQIVRGTAKAFKGKVVDVYSAFQGQETVYTHILGVFVGMPLSVAFHPSDAGYAAIAQEMIGDDD